MCTLHTAHCTLHTAHCKLHTAHCTLHTEYVTAVLLKCCVQEKLKKTRVSAPKSRSSMLRRVPAPDFMGEDAGAEEELGSSPNLSKVVLGQCNSCRLDITATESVMVCPEMLCRKTIHSRCAHIGFQCHTICLESDDDDF